MSMLRRGKWPLRFLILVVGLLHVLCTVEAQAHPVYWVAFWGVDRADQDKSSLYLVKSDGTDLHLVTPMDPFYYGTLAWSRDGKWIAYVYEGDLYRINIDDGTIERLLDNEPVMQMMGYPLDGPDPIARKNLLRTSPFDEIVWSLDDLSLYLIIRSAPNLPVSAVNERNIFRLDIASRELTQLTHVSDPFFAWQISLISEDTLTYAERTYCAECPIPRARFYTLALTEDQSSHLISVPGDEQDKELYWLPSNRRLYLLHNEGNEMWKLQSMALDGTDRQTIAEFQAMDAGLMLVNDQWIYVWMNHAYVESTLRLPINGGEWQTLDDESIGYPSPDGEQIAIRLVHSFVFSDLRQQTSVEVGSRELFDTITNPIWSPVPIK